MREQRAILTGRSTLSASRAIWRANPPAIVYLAAVVDVASRRVLAHRVSTTMEAASCVEALEEALVRHVKPEIFNTDQGSQFTDVAPNFYPALSLKRYPNPWRRRRWRQLSDTQLATVDQGARARSDTRARKPC